ncbi:ETT1 [Candida oxycetoniae]|uniref:Enhancer of translation termination 1 n=1 Tax=Candida oxycetoniae TaxID=497107 RepID=A0AAI9T1A9_9ASCO|nr:ETT1 [Candida oxycetoniae]KAI3406769.2 ETT1 [Candida oxycetoniae]
MVKRTLGLGNLAKVKKQKLKEEKRAAAAAASKEEEKEVEDNDANQLSVALPEEVDANDEIAQLKGLFKTYINSERDDELILNGIIHECDRLLRKQDEEKDDKNKNALGPDFYKIYAIALSELANFHTDDIKQVGEFFEAGIERVEDGLAKHPDNIDLQFTLAKISINQIVLQYISQLSLESKLEGNDIKRKLDKALQVYESAEAKAKESNNFEAFGNEEYFDILEAVDDLLDIVDNFGKDVEDEEDEKKSKEVTEETEEDDEEEEEKEEKKEEEDDDDEEEVELAETHPLYAIKNTDEYNQWWRDHTITYLENLDKLATPSPTLRKQLNHRLGQSYLKEAEIPCNVYTTLKYDEDYQGIEELQGLTLKESKKIAQDLMHTALEYLKQAENKEEPESWVDIAEAMISLANLYDLESEEQESLYKDAEKLLNKANNATNGKYQDVLDNFLQ